MAKVNFTGSVYKIEGRAIPNIDYSITNEYIGFDVPDGSVFSIFQNGKFERTIYSTEQIADLDVTNTIILNITQIVGSPFKGLKTTTKFAISTDFDFVVTRNADGTARIRIDNNNEILIDTVDTYAAVLALIAAQLGDAAALLAANNLSELTNFATARTNLNVYSQDETDALISPAVSANYVDTTAMIADQATHIEGEIFRTGSESPYSYYEFLGTATGSISDYSNITSQVGDVPVKASTAEAEAATNDTKFLTPLKGRQGLNVITGILSSLNTTDKTTLVAAVNEVNTNKADKQLIISRKTASYTLVLGDSSTLVEMNVAAANTLTVPPNSSVAFPVGTQILLSQYGAGQTTVTAGAGVTIRSAGSALKLAGTYSAATLIKIGTDEWYLFGDIVV